MMRKTMFFVALTTAVALGSSQTSSAYVQSGYASVVAGNLNCFTFPATCFENANPRQTVFVPGVYLVRNINNSGVDKWYEITSKKDSETEEIFEIEEVNQDCDECRLEDKGE